MIYVNGWKQSLITSSLDKQLTVIITSVPTNDPVATARAILDGHIALSREFAELGLFPAIDINQSLSRVMNSIITDEHKDKAELAKKYFSIYQENKDLVLMGGYITGQNEEIDKSINCNKIAVIKQDYRKRDFDRSMNLLRNI